MSKEMKNSGIPWIGDIPKDWRIVRNKNVFSNSKILVGDAWNTTQLLSLTTKGIKAVAIGSTSGKVPDSYDTYQVVEKDNIVMCLFDLDCSAVFSGLSPIHGMISPAYKALTIKNGFLPDFYAKWFDYIFDGRKFMFLSKNIRYSLTYDEFASLQVVAPSLLEQQKIASFLDKKCSEIDEMIALQEKIVEELKAYRQSVITEAVTKGLNPDVPMKDSGIEWIGEIPEHWKVDLLSLLFEEHKQKNTGLLCKNLLSLSYGKIVRKNIDSVGGLLPQSYDGYNIVDKGDIVFRLTDLQNDKKSLRTGLVRERGIVTSAYVTLRSRKPVLSAYYQYLFHSYDVMKVFYGMGDGVRQGMNYGDLRKMLIVTPPHSEQNEIVEFLDTKCTEIDNLISIKLSKIDSLNEYKKSIIYEYVTGKKEVIE